MIFPKVINSQFCKPRAGSVYFNMCQSKIRFKRTLRECKQNEEIIRANEHAKSFMDKNMISLWKGIKKNDNSRVPLAPMIDKCIITDSSIAFSPPWQ